MPQPEIRVIDLTVDALVRNLALEVERIVVRTLDAQRRDHRTATAHLPDGDWLTNAQARQLLGVSRSTLQRYRDVGRLPFAKVGSCVYYRRADIHALLERNLVRTEAEVEA